MELINSTFCLLVLTFSFKLSASEWSADGRIGFRFYTGGPNSYLEKPMESGLKIFRNTHYNSTLSLVILIHGMDASVDCIFIEESVKAMYFRGVTNNFNIIALNLPELLARQSVMDKYLYTTAVNSKIAGIAIGEFLNEVIDKHLTSPDKIHVIGYSMGAQVAGYLAREVKKAHGPIRYIMALDPAGIGFTPSTFAAWYTGLVHVTDDDAEFVHFMHCNSIGWGTLYYNATANFIFNGGYFQPGCATSKNFGCSHNRVPFYFIESVLYPNKFVAQKCDSWGSFTSCRCSSHETVNVSFPPMLGATGNYYLHTNSETPFGKGDAGVKCQEKTEPEEENVANKKNSQKRSLKLNCKYVKTSRRKVCVTRHSSSFQHMTADRYEKLHPKKSPSHTKNKTKHYVTTEKQITTNTSLEDMMEHINGNIVNK